MRRRNATAPRSGSRDRHRDRHRERSASRDDERSAPRDKKGDADEEEKPTPFDEDNDLVVNLVTLDASTAIAVEQVAADTSIMINP